MTTEDRLIDEYTDWLADNDLPDESADELILTEGLTPDQVAWLRDFILRWEDFEMERAAELRGETTAMLAGGVAPCPACQRRVTALEDILAALGWSDNQVANKVRDIAEEGLRP